MSLFRIFLMALALAVGTGHGAELAIRRMPGGPRFGVVGTWPSRPAPTIFVFQGSLEDVERQPLYVQAAEELSRQGFLGIVLDAPAHGEDRRAGEPAELEGWRWRIDHGENFVRPFTARASALLSYLVQQGVTDPRRVAAFGTSRGGYLAFQFAAADPRIRAVGGISPVTDLLALREFRGTPAGELASTLSLRSEVPPLAARPVWICIGNRDTRVGTEPAIAFARSLAKAGAERAPPEKSVPVTLIVNDTPGHRSSPRDHDALAAWLREQLSRGL